MGINFSPAMKNLQLLKLAKAVTTEKLCSTCDTNKENGNDGWHLYAYHRLKPYKLVWGDIKNRLAQECMCVN